MERDQHSSAGHGGGDRRPEAPPAADLQDAAAKPAEPAVQPEPGAGARPDVIMSKLPRTRPQRATGRRQREPGTSSTEGAATPRKGAPTAASRKRAAAQRTTPAKRSAGPAQRSAPGRPKARTGTAARAAQQGTAGRATQAEATARSRAARRAPAARTSPRSAPARRSRNGTPPGLPRLAVDGAVEAAKLPLKVGGRLTLRALDAVARGLRGG